MQLIYQANIRDDYWDHFDFCDSIAIVEILLNSIAIVVILLWYCPPWHYPSRRSTELLTAMLNVDKTQEMSLERNLLEKFVLVFMETLILWM